MHKTLVAIIAVSLICTPALAQYRDLPGNAGAINSYAEGCKDQLYADYGLPALDVLPEQCEALAELDLIGPYFEGEDVIQTAAAGSPQYNAAIATCRASIVRRLGELREFLRVNDTVDGMMVAKHVPQPEICSKTGFVTRATWTTWRQNVSQQLPTVSKWISDSPEYIFSN